MNLGRLKLRSPLDFPSVFVSASFAAIWMLWPARPAGKPPARARMRICYERSDSRATSVSDPLQFVRRPRSEVGDVNLIQGPPSGLQIQREPSPKFLNLVPGPDRISPAGEPPLYRSASDTLADYTPNWGDTRVFRAGASATNGISVRVGGALTERGFEMTEPGPEELSKLKGRSEVAVSVRVDEAGRPEHVFLDKGCGVAETDSMTIRNVYGGRAAKPGTACSGTITVIYCFP